MSVKYAAYRSVSLQGECETLPVTIYALVDPRDQTVRYVGQSESPKERLKAHRISGCATNARVRDWVVKLHDCGLQPLMRRIVMCSRHDAADEERYWIRFYRRVGFLYNIADGGKMAKDGCTRCGATLVCASCTQRDAAEKRKRKEADVRDEKHEAYLSSRTPLSAADVGAGLSRW